MTWIAAILAATGLILFGLGVPMWMARVPPNRWYGFRTPRTLAEPAVWYGTNRIVGRNLAVAGALMAVLGMLPPVLLSPDVWTDPGAIWWLLAPTLPVWIAVVHGVWASSSWVADHDAARRTEPMEPTAAPVSEEDARRAAKARAHRHAERSGSSSQT